MVLTHGEHTVNRHHVMLDYSLSMVISDPPMTIELIVLTIENELQILKLISFELEELNRSRLLTLKKINSKLLFLVEIETKLLKKLLKQNFYKVENRTLFCNLLTVNPGNFYSIGDLTSLASNQTFQEC